MLDDDVLHLPITELADRIRTRALSPVALTEAFLARIARLNGRFNAYVTVTAELALAQARAAERDLAAGRYRGPLHGIPYGAKDLLDTHGIATAWGTRFLADRVPDRDATVVARLRDAGAVLLGKLAMVEFAGGLGYRFANASASGPGRNPWNPERWTGGSSSGSGAAVAGGLAAFAIGTETWGSILCPSAFCGVTGFRPTYGLVSRAGGMVCANTFDKIGPLARSAADCRLVLDAISGPDPLDRSSVTAKPDLRAGRGRPLSKLRGALVRMDFAQGGEPEAGEAFERVVAEWKSAGLALEEAKLPEFPAAEVAGLLITVEALAAFEPFFKDGRVKQLVDAMAQRQVAIAEPITGADTMKAWRMRTELQRRVATFFETYDVILTPNFKNVAPPVDRDLNETLAYGDPVGAIGNACGLPAIALPGGAGRDGLPVGFQLVAAPHDDATLLDLGDVWQSRTAFHRHWPRP